LVINMLGFLAKTNISATHVSQTNSLIK